MIYFCAQANRRELVLQSPSLNGIDYLEVLGDPGTGTELAITFLKDARSLALTRAGVELAGGVAVSVVSIAPATAADPTTATIVLDQTGDFSTYTLTLAAVPGLDPQLSSVEFSFKAGCATPADCLPTSCCPSPAAAPPDINYLAKDYNGFLQVMLDRLAVLAPTWTETHAADLGIAMTEALAYAADHLSYQQDAVSTEAYLGTARSRISLRRHARLVDYTISEGCNARTLVFITAAANAVTVPVGTEFYLGGPGLAVASHSGDAVARALLATTQPVFGAMQGTTLFTAHNAIQFYTWGDGDCCLTTGATQATLCGPLPDLKVGEILIFEEVLGPDTGQPEDANPDHRCAVCLTQVLAAKDPLNGTDIVEITWSPEDALPIPVCISSTSDAAHGSIPVVGVSVARGNIAPADHGTWIAPPLSSPDPTGESLGQVPPPPPAPDPSTGCSCGATSPVSAPVPRYYPSLAQAPLTFSVPFASPITSAAAFLAPDVSTASAAQNIIVADSDHFTWSLSGDLLSSGPGDRGFVLEIEFDGTVFLRFGDGQYGMAPDPGVTFYATYRTGNGTSGNIGRDTLAHAVLPSTWLGVLSDIASVRNPLPGTGGVDPEDMNHIRQFAPFAYEGQDRCVTEADYGAATTELTGGLAARGTLRWTGSWYAAFVSIDPAELTPTVVAEATTGLGMQRMMGTDVAVEAAVIVGLQIVLEICVDPGHFRGDVYDALMEIFITGDQCDGSSGLLNASNFSFGQTVYASPLIAAAQAVQGVLSVTLVQFTRMDAPWVDGIALGCLTMGRLDIPRCDNDPDHLDHGTFTVQMDGGK